MADFLLSSFPSTVSPAPGWTRVGTTDVLSEQSAGYLYHGNSGSSNQPYWIRDGGPSGVFGLNLYNWGNSASWIVWGMDASCENGWLFEPYTKDLYRRDAGVNTKVGDHAGASPTGNVSGGAPFTVEIAADGGFTVNAVIYGSPVTYHTVAAEDNPHSDNVYVGIRRTTSTGVFYPPIYFTNLVILDPPTGLTATATDAFTVSLEWDAVEDATLYHIYRDGVEVGTSATTTYEDTDLDPETEYDYTVSTESADGEGDQSSIVSVTTPSSIDVLPGADWTTAFNQLAATTGLEATAAANVLAGTSGLSLVGALNAYNGTTGLGLNAVCNEIAGTSGLEALDALRQI